ncbi:peroxidase 18-like [Apium graveolens]|uniref:peroxidase 18-like n=1 Tax=Apium graveolens TaxID=4045 RepID=UPI003D7B1E86
MMFIYIMLLYLSFSTCSSELAFDFYADSCPLVETMVKDTVRSASLNDPKVPGKLLRLLFHDCFVEGCDGSVLVQGNDTERSDPANASLGGFEVIEAAKNVVETFCPATVSCADILALAARDSVEFTGGPGIEIPTGRKDGKISLASNVRPNIVDTSFTLNQMKHIFSAKGLSFDDLVTLSGAHTIGSAHCSAFSERFRLDTKGKLKLIDTSLDRTYAAELTQQCGSSQAQTSVTVNNDPETPFIFDNQYYQMLLAHKGLFQSDAVLLDNAKSLKKVEEFANDKNSFFDNWTEAFLKLASIGVKTGEDSEIRRSCSVING